MKKTSQIFTLIAIVLLSLNTTSYSQNPHPVIILKVNTTLITQATIEEYCSFEGQSTDVTLANFTTLVKKGDKIRWKGISISSGVDKVKIKSIIYKSGVNVLGKDIIKGKKEVEGTVENGNPEDELIYSITFEVHKKDKGSKESFTIDPKLRIN